MSSLDSATSWRASVSRLEPMEDISHSSHKTFWDLSSWPLCPLTSFQFTNFVFLTDLDIYFISFFGHCYLVIIYGSCELKRKSVGYCPVGYYLNFSDLKIVCGLFHRHGMEKLMVQITVDKQHILLSQLRTHNKKGKRKETQ